MKPTTLIYGISAEKGATINPMATQSLSIRFISVPNCSIEDIKTGASHLPANVKAVTMAVLDIGDNGVNVRPPEGDIKPDAEAMVVIEQRAAIGLKALMDLYQSAFEDIDIVTAPSFTEFLETCVKDKFLTYAAEQIEEYVLKDAQPLDTSKQLRLDCVDNYIKSINATQLGKGN